VVGRGRAGAYGRRPRGAEGRLLRLVHGLPSLHLQLSVRCRYGSPDCPDALLPGRRRCRARGRAHGDERPVGNRQPNGRTQATTSTRCSGSKKSSETLSTTRPPRCPWTRKAQISFTSSIPRGEIRTLSLLAAFKIFHVAGSTGRWFGRVGTPPTSVCSRATPGSAVTWETLPTTAPRSSGPQAGRLGVWPWSTQHDVGGAQLGSGDTSAVQDPIHAGGDGRPDRER